MRSLRFVLANCGHKLRWESEEERFTFWKSEVRPHIVEETRLYLEDYPGGYCYRASEWHLGNGNRVVLLEMYH